MKREEIKLNIDKLSDGVKSLVDIVFKLNNELQPLLKARRKRILREREIRNLIIKELTLGLTYNEYERLYGVLL